MKIATLCIMLFIAVMSLVFDLLHSIRKDIKEIKNNEKANKN